MSPSYQELLAQQKSLAVQIAAARETELAEALTQARRLVQEYQLTETDLFSGKKTRRQSGKPRAAVAPKFRDPASGATWSGRGKAPRWIADQDRARFVI